MNIVEMAELMKNQKAIIAATRNGIVVSIETFIIPPTLRGKGVGRASYEKWESGLPKTIRFVTCVPVDGGGGFSGPFWQKLGFINRYLPDDDPDFGVPVEMIKGVNGTPTPAPIPYPIDNEE